MRPILLTKPPYHYVDHACPKLPYEDAFGLGVFQLLYGLRTKSRSEGWITGWQLKMELRFCTDIDAFLLSPGSQEKAKQSRTWWRGHRGHSRIPRNPANPLLLPEIV